MQKKILITGGAGFIGSHLANELIEQGHQVRVLDDLLAQVHGTDMAIQRASTPHKHHPDYLNPAVEVINGNVCNPSAVRYACDGKQVRDVLYVGI